MDELIQKLLYPKGRKIVMRKFSMLSIAMFLLLALAGTALAQRDITLIELTEDRAQLSPRW